jgi:hypothetical protein
VWHRRTRPPTSVDTFLAALEHPLKPGILALRQVILGVDPGIAEEIKWNAPSFRTSEHFATMHLRSSDHVQLILHFGARKRDMPGLAIADPDGLLEWLGADRASVRFSSLEDLEARRVAFERIIRQWIAHV